MGSLGFLAVGGHIHRGIQETAKRWPEEEDSYRPRWNSLPKP